MNKKGLSELIATVLIVLIALAGVALAWNFLRGSFENTGSDIENKINCIDVELEPKKCEIVGSNARLTVQVKKGTSEGFIGVIEFADGSRKAFQLNETLDTFATRTVSIPLSGGQAVRGRVAALLKDSQGVFENCDLSGTSAECFSPSGGTPECINDNECDDGNVCTLDRCVGGSCDNTDLSDGTSCDDGVWCSGVSQCESGVCQGVASVCGASYPDPRCSESAMTCSCDVGGEPEDSYCLPPATVCDPVLLVCVPGPNP